MRLSQAIAIETGAKKKAHTTATTVHRVTQSEAAMNGLHRRYEPVDDLEIAQPDETKLASATTQEAFDLWRADYGALLDITATKDYGNMTAKADLVVDGVTLLTNAPVPLFLYLEKMIVDLITATMKMVELDPARHWEFDKLSGKWKADPTRRATTQKRQRPLVLYDATEHHPAQTQIVSEDIVVGHWVETKESGAIPRETKRRILERLSKLLTAVKTARTEANSVKVAPISVGQKLFDFMFAVDGSE